MQDYSYLGVGKIYLREIGAALGFLYYNFDPARVFLGDAGSVPLGFLGGAGGHGQRRGGFFKQFDFHGFPLWLKWFR